MSRATRNACGVGGAGCQCWIHPLARVAGPEGVGRDCAHAVADVVWRACRYCASDWATEVSAQRPAWTGAVSFDTGTSTMCRCIQAIHWCKVGPAGSCGVACSKVGVPTPSNVCVPAPVVPLGFAVTADPTEFANFTAHGWSERCAGTAGSSVFCAGDPDGREGPFMVYTVADAVPGALPLHRCCATTSPAVACQESYLSTAAVCPVGDPASATLIGYISPRRGGETLRALRRCTVDGHPDLSKHALDLPCVGADPMGELLGFVR